MIGITNSLGTVEEPPEKLFAFQKRRRPQVVSIAIQKVEHEIDHRKSGKQFLPRMAHVHAFLQHSEIATPPAIQNDNFSVEHSLSAAERVRKRSQVRILRGDVSARPCAQLSSPSSINASARTPS